MPAIAGSLRPRGITVVCTCVRARAGAGGGEKLIMGTKVESAGPGTVADRPTDQMWREMVMRLRAFVRRRIADPKVCLWNTTLHRVAAAPDNKGFPLACRGANPGRVGGTVRDTCQARQVLPGLSWAAQLAAQTDRVAACGLAGLSSVTL